MSRGKSLLYCQIRISIAEDGCGVGLCLPAGRAAVVLHVQAARRSQSGARVANEWWREPRVSGRSG